MRGELTAETGLSGYDVARWVDGFAKRPAAAFRRRLPQV